MPRKEGRVEAGLLRSTQLDKGDALRLRKFIRTGFFGKILGGKCILYTSQKGSLYYVASENQKIVEGVIPVVGAEGVNPCSSVLIIEWNRNEKR